MSSEEELITRLEILVKRRDTSVSNIQKIIDDSLKSIMEEMLDGED